MSHIFNSENYINWWCLLLLMLLSFLLGWFLSQWFCKKSSKKTIAADGDKKEKAELDTGHKKENEHAKTTFSKRKIRATKTMERSGQSVEKKILNFERFGVATESEKDDLKKISGVGPFIEKKLNEIGIYTFDQVSKFSDKDIKNVTDLIEFFPGRILRDDWRNQAKRLKKAKQTKANKPTSSKKNNDAGNDKS